MRTPLIAAAAFFGGLAVATIFPLHHTSSELVNVFHGAGPRLPDQRLSRWQYERNTQTEDHWRPDATVTRDQDSQPKGGHRR